ncbi:hypothetical protein IT407_03865 [Candidatus Uhrbacteria bacterium]|nr:hypothetical protein [Candidatus Uhrbacteria bacterium]
MITDFRHELLERHSALLSETKAKYEQSHGPISGPGEYFKLVTLHPDFQYLRPLSEAIVQIDEAMEHDPSSPHEELEQSLREKLCDFLNDAPNN